MPYTVNSSNLPKYIKNKPERIRKKWVSIFNKVFKEEGEESALIAANGWLKREMKKLKKFHKRAVLRFETSDKQFIKRTKDGDDYVSFKLADTQQDYLGVQLTEDVLQSWADYINSGEPFVGDIDHQQYDDILNGMYSENEITDMIRSKKGIAKGVQAMYDQGILWVKALIDKRYRKVIEKAKGVSLEALIEKDEHNKVVGADLLGFTFGVDHEPVISGTEVHYGIS